MNKQRKYNVAVVGARGAVGQKMYQIVKERSFPANEVRMFSTSAEKDFEDNGIRYEKLTEENAPEKFKDIDIGLFSPGAAVSKIFAPIAAKQGCVVIDNTSAFRMEKDVPLVVPEVNPQDIAKHSGIIANPNCSTIQMVVALKPLHDFGKIKRIVVSTYQSVSGAGGGGPRELKAQLDGSPKVEKFQHQIMHNLIPHIDVPQENLYTKEEMKMVNETQKIMGDPAIRVSATCVRVPVFRAHSEAVWIETERPLDVADARALLQGAPGVTVVDDPAALAYPTPLDASGKGATYVGRIRQDLSADNGLTFWVVSDNLLKGAALNAVQIAELLVEKRLLG